MIQIEKTNLVFVRPEKPRVYTDRIIVHHSATASGDAYSIHKYHTEVNGWPDGIGYHFVILPNGTIQEGRSVDLHGAHTVGENFRSVGVCFIGNFEKTCPTLAQYDAFNELHSWLNNYYGKKLPVFRHCDFNATVCPGQNFDLSQIVQKDGELSMPVLRNGSYGYAVEVLQVLLNHLVTAHLAVDGDFGPATARCVSVFQRQACLDIDEIVGPLTWDKLLKEGV